MNTSAYLDPAHLPNVHGFSFVGLFRNGIECRCEVRLTPDGYSAFSGDERIYSALAGWRRGFETNTHLPTVEEWRIHAALIAFDAPYAEALHCSVAADRRAAWAIDPPASVAMIDATVSGHECGIEMALTDPVERTVVGVNATYIRRAGAAWRVLSFNRYGREVGA